MIKKLNRLHNKNSVRQKMSGRLSILVGFSILAIAGTGLTLYFNLGHTDSLKARNNAPENTVVVPEQTFVNEFTIPEPVLLQQPKADANTIFVRKLKAASAITN